MLVQNMCKANNKNKNDVNDASGVFIVNFELVPYAFVLFLFSTLNR